MKVKDLLKYISEGTIIQVYSDRKIIMDSRYDTKITNAILESDIERNSISSEDDILHICI